MKTVRYSTDALKDLRAVPGRQVEAIRSKIEQYASDPASLANNVKRLQGRPGARLRVGDYRVIFNEELVVITVIRVGHRSKVYD